MSRARREAHRAWRDTAAAGRRARQFEARFVFDEARECPMCQRGQHDDVARLVKALAPDLGAWPPVPIKSSARRPGRGARGSS